MIAWKGRGHGSKVKTDTASFSFVILRAEETSSIACLGTIHCEPLDINKRDQTPNHPSSIHPSIPSISPSTRLSHGTEPGACIPSDGDSNSCWGGGSCSQVCDVAVISTMFPPNPSDMAGNSRHLRRACLHGSRRVDRLGSHRRDAFARISTGAAPAVHHDRAVDQLQDTGG